MLNNQNLNYLKETIYKENPMPEYSHTYLVVLAGGKASRMGGIYKPLLKIRGKTLLEIIVNNIGLIARKVYIVVHSLEQLEYLTSLKDKLSRTEILVDLYEKRSPVTGMYTASRHIPNGIVMFAPADTPFLTHRAYVKLIRYLEGHDGAVPVWPNGYVEPLISVYNSQPLKKALEKALSEGDLRARAPIDYLDVVKVPVDEVFSEPKLETFNINTFEEYMRAEEICNRALKRYCS